MMQPRTTDWEALRKNVKHLHPEEVWTKECQIAQLYLTGSFDLYLDIEYIHKRPVWVAYLRVDDVYRRIHPCLYLRDLCKILLDEATSEELRATLLSMHATLVNINNNDWVSIRQLLNDADA